MTDKYIITLLILACINLTLPQSSSGQWYSEQFGVDSMTQLSPEQYDQAINNFNHGIERGKRATYVGLGGIASGILIWKLANTMDKNGNLEGAVGFYLLSISLTGVSSLVTLVSGLSWSKNSDRKILLERAFGKSMSGITISPLINNTNNQTYYGMGFRIPINRNLK